MPRMQPIRFDPQALTRGLKDRAVEWDAKLRSFMATFSERISNLPQTNYDLGRSFAERGQVKDAAFRFKVAVYFAPGFTQAWYNLGCCQLALGQKEKAVQSFRKTLALDPVHEDAKFMLVTIDPNLLPLHERPQRMPSHMMEGFFARIAPQYDALEAQMQYAGPALLYQKLRGLLGRGDVRMLDMGCGTGLSAAPWRKEASYIAGVDATAGMVQLARQAQVDGRPVFDVLDVQDANLPHAQIPGGAYELVIALNVLPYAGEPTGFVTNMARSAAEGGMVAFSFELYSGQGGYGIVPATGRFGHNPDFLKQVAIAAGLRLADQDALEIYPQMKVPLLVFTKVSQA